MNEVTLTGPHAPMLAGGLAPVQRAVREEEYATAHQRGFMTMTAPGLLQTENYIRTVLAEVIEMYGGPGDLDEGVAERLNRYLVVTDPDDLSFFVTAFECADRHAVYGEDAARIVDAVRTELEA